jgi:hypothetical protein
MASHMASPEKSQDILVDKTEDTRAADHPEYAAMKDDANSDDEDATVTLKTWLVVFVSASFHVERSLSSRWNRFYPWDMGSHFGPYQSLPTSAVCLVRSLTRPPSTSGSFQ